MRQVEKENLGDNIGKSNVKGVNIRLSMSPADGTTFRILIAKRKLQKSVERVWDCECTDFF